MAGDPTKTDTQEMLRTIQRQFLPNALVFLHPPEAEGDSVRTTIPLVQDKRTLGGGATAYVCQNFACQAPTNDIADLAFL